MINPYFNIYFLFIPYYFKYFLFNP